MTTSQQDKLTHPLLASVREQLSDNASFLALDVPGRKDEEWRFVRLDGVMNANVSMATSAAKVDAKTLAAYNVPEAKGRALVFVNMKRTAEDVRRGVSPP